ncbi:MAG: hypothetical protein DME10_14120 [Candidatus Rokuibacteriota bacterium]|nr:MAG: hypothetical protein DME10_14120 [Candidatus Rokubacteria bacterium]
MAGKHQGAPAAAGLPARCRVRAGWPGQPLTATIFQEFALFPWRTAEANAAFGLEELDIPAAERRARVRRFITMTGLEGFEGKYPHQLSGGMRQRVGIARALSEGLALLLRRRAAPEGRATGAGRELMTRSCASRPSTRRPAPRSSVWAFPSMTVMAGCSCPTSSVRCCGGPRTDS